MRGGPDKDHDVAWIYTRVGWPVEITAEFENWRRIRDSDGSEGWVYHSLLSGKRMAAVQLKAKTDLAPLYAKPDATSAVTAQLQVGVLGAVKSCSGTWCQISGKGFDGWIQQNELWGVYPGEKIRLTAGDDPAGTALTPHQCADGAGLTQKAISFMRFMRRRSARGMLAPRSLAELSWSLYTAEAARPFCSEQYGFKDLRADILRRADGRDRRVAALDGDRHRLGRVARARPLHVDRRRLSRLGVGRQPLSNRRSGRRIHRSGQRHRGSATVSMD